METLASTESASPNTEPEIHLLLERDAKNDWRRWRAAAVVSLFVHTVLLITLLLMPESVTNERIYITPPITRITPLYIPTELTQKAPNQEKLSKDLSLEAIKTRPVIKAPTPPPAAKSTPPAAPKAAPLPQPPLPQSQVARMEPKPVVAEPPRLELPKSQESQTDQLAKLNQPPLPPPPAQPPKLAMENVAPPPPSSSGPGQNRQLRQIVIPNTSVDAAVRDLTNNGGGVGGRQIVEDSGADAGPGAGLNLPPSAGRPKSNLELRSDPQGVDFRPYMQQVLAAVRRNWFAVYPEAARLGQRGEVILEFAIAKQGTVTKVIFSTESGAKALDQSAVAAISASNPLPPLPAGFKGDRIVLRMTFMYNMLR
jgi:TonB family protein